MTIIARTLLHLPLAALVVAASACSDDAAPPAEDHTPVTYNVLVDDAAATAPYTFTAAQTVRVRLKFFNAAKDDLDDVEADHFGGLAFNPASLATVTRVTRHNYQIDVTGGTAGTGTLQVSYGHDEAARRGDFRSRARDGHRALTRGR